MVYKGYELLKAIANGEIKEGSKFKAEYRTFVVKNGYLFMDYSNRQEYATSFELAWDFELIEDEMDNIEELSTITNNVNGIACLMNKINQLIQVVNQLNKKVKQLEEDK